MLPLKIKRSREKQRWWLLPKPTEELQGRPTEAPKVERQSAAPTVAPEQLFLKGRYYGKIILKSEKWTYEIEKKGGGQN